MKKHTSVLALALVMSAFAGSMAQAADLAPPPPPQIRPAVSDWTGPYLGAVLGGTCMDATHNVGLDSPAKDGVIDTTYDNLPINGCGLSGGFVAGFNYQLDNVLLGLEGDWTWGDRTGEHTDINGPGIERDHFKIKWQASLRARLGLLTTDKTLLYVTGGASWLHGKAYETAPVSVEDTNTHTGYVVGGGIEHALTENLHLRAEYLYSSYNTKKYGRFINPVATEPDVEVDVDPDNVHTFRLGVTWNFPVSLW